MGLNYNITIGVLGFTYVMPSHLTVNSIGLLSLELPIGFMPMHLQLLSFIFTLVIYLFCLTPYFFLPIAFSLFLPTPAYNLSSSTCCVMEDVVYISWSWHHTIWLLWSSSYGKCVLLLVIMYNYYLIYLRKETIPKPRDTCYGLWWWNKILGFLTASPVKNTMGC